MISPSPPSVTTFGNVAPAVPQTAGLPARALPGRAAGSDPGPPNEPPQAEVGPDGGQSKRTFDRIRAAGDWMRDTGLGITGFLMVLGVALAGWTASFIGLHDFGTKHMELSSDEAWLVPITFDGAAAGLSLVVFRASIHARGAAVWRFLIIVFTALSAWVNWAHISDPTGRWIACFMPPSAVILFEGLMSEARAAASRRQGRERPRLHPLRWVIDRPGTWEIYRNYVLGLELPEQYREAASRLDDTTATKETAETETTASRRETETGQTSQTSQTETESETETKTETKTLWSPQGRETGEPDAESGTQTGSQSPPRTKESAPAEQISGAQVSVSPIGTPETETRKLLALMKQRGGPMTVSLDDAITATRRPKSTAAKRLAEARRRYATGTSGTETETGTG